MSTTKPLVRKHSGDFRWESVDVLTYKQEGSAPFKDVTRQVHFEGSDPPAQLRYFEVAAGGYTVFLASMGEIAEHNVRTTCDLFLTHHVPSAEPRESVVFHWAERPELREADGDAASN